MTDNRRNTSHAIKHFIEVDGVSITYFKWLIIQFSSFFSARKWGEPSTTRSGIKFVESRQLTEGQLLKLSQYLTNKSDLRRLAVIGLQMKEHVVDSKISSNTNDMESAAYNVLKTWRNSQENIATAHRKLRNALKKVNMKFLIAQVFLSNTN